jgi:GNAT superfamily N-acetyltransferase
MRIQQAQPGDLDLLCRLRVAFLAEHRGVEVEMLPNAFVEETRLFLEHMHQSGAIRSWLGEVSGRCVGLVSVVLHDAPPVPEDTRTHEGYVINMYVDPLHRRQGVGKALLETCLASAPELGIRRFYLRATDDGRSIYQLAGFAPNDLMELPVANHNSPNAFDGDAVSETAHDT